MHLKTLLFALICLTQSLAAQAAVTFNSGPNKVSLLELYTSEGCSSCPPADNWLSDFQDQPTLWQDIIPVAFHVDYWNHLGWKDPFSSATHAQRQYQYQRHGNIRSVYTPGFVLNGRESRNWFYKNALPEINEPAGELTLHVDDKAAITATYQSKHHQQQPLVLNIVLLGFDLETRIAAGENRGKVLKHNFVALSHQQSLSSTRQWQVSLPAPVVDSNRTALAAWISTTDNQAPLQATGGWLP